MGLFDDCFNPRQFGEGGGLLGRLLALQQQQGQCPMGGSFDEATSASLTPVTQLMRRANPPGYGQPVFGSPTAAPNLTSQYQALRQVLGDHDAMMATINPDVGKTLIAQALAKDAAV